MKEPHKPTSIADIELPFGSVGEEGWASSITTLLGTYGAPISRPSTKKEVEAIATACRGPVLQKYKLFMEAIGPLDLGYVEFLRPSKVQTGDQTWYGSAISGIDIEALKAQLVIVELGGSGDFFSLSLTDNKIRYLCHDPLGMRIAFHSFDDLVKWSISHVFVGEYGWPDQGVEELVDQYQSQLTELLI